MLPGSCHRTLLRTVPAQSKVPIVLKRNNRDFYLNLLNGTLPLFTEMRKGTVPSLLRYQAACFFALIRPRATSSSAIWMALRAAPLRRLSETTHRLRPFSTVASSRMREM